MNTDPDPDALIECAYRVHAGPLLRRLTASTRDPAAAEDVTQEAFLRLVIEVRAGHVPDDIGAWLHRVGQNLVTSRGRRLTVARRRNAELERPDSTPSPELLTVEAETNRSLRAALWELGPMDRRALILAAEGYRGPEIARSMGRTDAATRTLLCRARNKLRARMTQVGAA